MKNKHHRYEVRNILHLIITESIASVTHKYGIRNVYQNIIFDLLYNMYYTVNIISVVFQMCIFVIF